MKHFLPLISLMILLQSCYQNSKTDHGFIKKGLLCQDDFSSENSDDWIAELQDDLGNVGVKDGVLEIDVPKGATVWYKQKFEGDILIEYKATVIDNDGPNDRVSDLNCFWMASDLRQTEDYLSLQERQVVSFMITIPCSCIMWVWEVIIIRRHDLDATMARAINLF